MDYKNAVWTVVKIIAVAAAAAVIIRFERDAATDEDTPTTKLSQGVFTWTLGFVIAAAGGLAVLATAGGALAVIGAVVLALGVIALVMGAGRDAMNRANGTVHDDLPADDEEQVTMTPVEDEDDVEDDADLDDEADDTDDAITVDTTADPARAEAQD